MAFLDPSYKDLNPFVPETEQKDVHKLVKCEMLDLTVTDDDETRPKADTNTQPSSSESQDGPPILRSLSLALYHTFSQI